MTNLVIINKFMSSFSKSNKEKYNCQIYMVPIFCTLSAKHNKLLGYTKPAKKLKRQQQYEHTNFYNN